MPASICRDGCVEYDQAWPTPAIWDALKRRVGSRLLKLQSPFAPDAPAAIRAEALKHLKNPFFIGDQPALTQTSRWADAWISRPSAYAETAADVTAAVKFARELSQAMPQIGKLNDDK